MFSRYKRLVPPSQREVITSRGLPHPDWFVGAAEQPLDPHDPAMTKLLRDVDDRFDRAEGGSGAAAEPVTSESAQHIHAASAPTGSSSAGL
jgi:hypothetical protein